MPDAASTKIQAALRTLALSALGPNVFIARSDAEPLNDDELPAAAIRILNIAFDYQEAMTLCTAEIAIDFVSGGGASQTIDQVNQERVALFVAALHADRTLGGRLIDCEEQSVTGDDRRDADIGCAPLALIARWFCPRGNLFTIIGQSGQTF